LVNRWLVAGVASVTLATSMVGWAQSGHALRSPYELRRSVLALDVFDGILADIIRYVWPIVPALVGAIWLASAFSLVALVRILGATVGIIVLATALAVWRSPLVATGGLWAGAGASVALILTSFVPSLPGQSSQGVHQ
jgi:hypothetical protein